MIKTAIVMLQLNFSISNFGISSFQLYRILGNDPATINTKVTVLSNMLIHSGYFYIEVSLISQSLSNRVGLEEY